MKKAILILSILIIGLLFGCTTGPTDIAMLDSSVQAFISEHPNAEIKLNLIPSADSSTMQEIIQTHCNRSLPEKDYYYITVNDSETNLKLHIWMEKDTQETVCAYQEGNQTDTPLDNNSGQPTNDNNTILNDDTNTQTEQFLPYGEHTVTIGQELNFKDATLTVLETSTMNNKKQVNFSYKNSNRNTGLIKEGEKLFSSLSEDSIENTKGLIVFVEEISQEGIKIEINLHTVITQSADLTKTQNYTIELGDYLVLDNGKIKLESITTYNTGMAMFIENGKDTAGGIQLTQGYPINAMHLNKQENEIYIGPTQILRNSVSIELGPAEETNQCRDFYKGTVCAHPDDCDTYNILTGENESCCMGTCINDNNIELNCNDEDETLTLEESYYIKSKIQGLEAPGIIDNWEDYCGVAGNEDGLLVEYSCKTDNYAEKILYDCPFGCSLGACQQPTCTDSDGNISLEQSYYIAGTTYGANDTRTAYTTRTDTCAGNDISEYYCENGEIKASITECTISCLNGRCLTVEDTNKNLEISSYDIGTQEIILTIKNVSSQPIKLTKIIVDEMEYSRAFITTTQPNSTISQIIDTNQCNISNTFTLNISFEYLDQNDDTQTQMADEFTGNC